MEELIILMSVSPLSALSSRSLLAGITASTAYLLAQMVDRRITGDQYDDLLLWGGFMPGDTHRQRVLGGAIHYGLGISLAIVYRTILPYLPSGPPWLQGLLFAQAENTVLYPGVPILGAIHPAVRDGRLPPLTTWRYFWLEASRHAAYGVVLGITSGTGKREAGRRLGRRPKR